MKFIVDAQLPKRLARFIQEQGYDCLHTQDLPGGNATSDTDINELSLREQRVVVTKDADFVQSFLLQNKPYKLLLPLLRSAHILKGQKRYMSRTEGLPILVNSFWHF